MLNVRDVDVHDVAARAAAADLTVSVVIPARDEEATIGPIVAAIHDDLVVGAGLVDEIVVIDGGSRDATAPRAAEAGARVVDQAPADGGTPVGGKGDAMWRGVAETSGEIVVFVDGDVVGFSSAWVAALASPLVDDPTAVFVKACYERAFGDDDEGGGRVTELLARPLLNAFWPELAAVVQPLAGEYAGRREVLEALPFPRGYGVEIGLLVDVARRHGVDAIAQVDLGTRGHAHQSIDALGRMSAEILATVCARLHAEGRLTAETSPLLWQPRRGPDGAPTLDAHEVARSERPPLRELAGR